MIKHSYPGTFIVFEGLDGSGQSTEVKLLAKFLQDKGKFVVKTKEPTKESLVARRLRKILDKKEKASAKQIQGLFSQDRKWHLSAVIVPALKQGKIIICDRYFFSSFAYGMADGVDLDYLLKINGNFLSPDIVFFLDVEADICVGRIDIRGKEKTLFEKKEKLEKVYQNYKIALKKFESQTNIYYINGKKSITEVFSQIKEVIKEHI